MNEQMVRLRALIGSAREGSFESVATIRNIMRKSVENAPPEAIIEMAQHLHDNRIQEIRREGEAN